MAVLQSKNRTADDSKEASKLKAVDLSDKSLKTGVKSKLDPTEDAWEFSAPPDMGRYRLKLFLGKEGFQQGLRDEEDSNSVYYQANLECKIVSDDSETNGYSVFATVTTKIGKRKNISTMAGLVGKCGYKVPTEATDLEIAKLFKAVLAKEPILGAELDWEAGYRDGKDWVRVFSSQEDFPEADGGGYEHVCRVTRKDGGKEEVRAQLKIKEWYGKNDKEESKAKPVKPSKTELVGDDEEEKEVEKEEKTKKTEKASKKEEKAEEDEDLSLLEEDE